MGFGQSKSEFASTIGNAGATPVTPGFRPETLKKPKNQTQVIEDHEEQSNSSPKTHIHTQIHVLTSAEQQNCQDKKMPTSREITFHGPIHNIGNFNPGGNNRARDVKIYDGPTEKIREQEDSGISSAEQQEDCQEEIKEETPSGQTLTFRGKIHNKGNFNPGGNNTARDVKIYGEPTEKIREQEDSGISSAEQQEDCQEEIKEETPSGQRLTFRGKIHNNGNLNPGGNNTARDVMNYGGPTEEIREQDSGISSAGQQQSGMGGRCEFDQDEPMDCEGY